MNLSLRVEPLPNCNTIPTPAPDYRLFAEVLNGWLTTLCVVLGTIGNINGVRSVHIRNLDKNRGVVLAVSMLALAFWDTVLLWCAFLYYSIKKLPIDIDTDVLNMLTPWFHPFSQIANTASIWCVVAITTQRLMATRDPFRTNRSAAFPQSFRSERRISFIYCSTYRRLFKMPLILSICAIILNLPSFFEIAAAACFNQETKKTAVQLLIKPFRTNAYYVQYRLISRMLFISIGPNIYILVVTLVIIYMIRGSNRTRQKLFEMSDNLLERQFSRENMQTMISIMLVIKFLLLRSLTFAMDIMEVTTGVHNFYLLDISNFLIIVNSATNCLIFLKATQWLNHRWAVRNTIRRKKTVCDASLQLGDRLSILRTSWQEAIRMTNGNLGLSILYSMLRKHPSLFNVFRTATQNGGSTEVSTTTEPELGCPMSNGSRRSFEVITNTKYREVADRITSFISEIIDLMIRGQSEQYIIMRIRRVGAIHCAKKIQLTSAVWKEFKASTTNIIAECHYENDVDRATATDAWNIFISFIIREMKMGTYAIGESLATIP